MHTKRLKTGRREVCTFFRRWRREFFWERILYEKKEETVDKTIVQGSVVKNNNGNKYKSESKNDIIHNKDFNTM